MKQKLLLKTMLLLCALVAGSSSVWAVDVIHYTLDGTETGGSSAYDSNSEIEQNSMSWIVVGNTTQNPWRIGGKNLNSNNGGDREVYSTTEMSVAITKVELEIGDINLPSVNSIKLIVASDAEFTLPLDEITKTEIEGNTTLTFTPTSPATEWATDAYYKFVFNVTTNGSNKYVQFKSAKFYKNVTLSDPTITFNNGSVNVGKTLDLNTLFTSNSEGAVTYSITSGDSYASLDGSTLTGIAEGSVTVQASQAASSEYNAKTATATITVNAALALSSIAITTAPTKTTYTEGETFDATGMVVTATYSDASTDDVTALCTWTPSGALTLSDTEITVSYTENETTKTATQNITVNAYVQPTDVEITLNNAFFGSTGTGNINDASLEGAQDRVTISINRNDGNKLYVNASQIRLYNKNTLVLTAPSGYIFTEVELVEPSSDKSWSGNDNTSTPTGYDDSSKTWTGASSSVTITFGGTCRIGGVNVTLAETKDVTITSATWASFSCDKALDFTGTGVTAYIAKAKDDSNVTLTEITKVPANTGIVVNGTAATHAIPVLSGDADETTGNLLKPWLTAGTPTETKYYTLAVDGGNPVFKKSSGGTLAAGKSYLVVSGADAPTLAVDFGETTGINTVNGSGLMVNGSEVYNLNGQRVAQPTKGLYIVNGKKVIIK